MRALAKWVSLKKARRDGLVAGYHGQEKRLPDKLELAKEYQAGFTEGTGNRQFDMASGVHPDLDLQPRHKRRRA